MGQKHYDWVDYAKGIGIILVVYGHVARGVFNAGMMSDEHLFRLVDSIIYSFHMPLFFFLAGLFFVRSITTRGEGGLIINKVDTIIYPYMVWSFIQGSIGYILSGVTNFSTSTEDVYSLLWKPHDQFWFLYALFLIFVTYTLIYRFIPNVIMLFIVSVLLYIFKDYLYSSWGIMNAIFKFGVYFCGGIVFAKYMTINIKIRPMLLIGSVVLFVLAQFVYHCYLKSSYVNYDSFMLLMLAVASIFFVVIVSMFLAQKGANLIRVIGTYTLQIYLVHILFGSGFRIVMQKALGIESSALHLICGTLVGIFVSILFVRMTKNLGLNFLFSIPKPSPAPILK